MRKKLEEEGVRFRAEIQQLAAQREAGIDYGNDPADDATEAIEKAMNLSLAERLGDSLLRVENALRRIQDGSYGYCEECGGAIEWGRLQVLPQATLCVECARRHERER